MALIATAAMGAAAATAYARRHTPADDAYAVGDMGLAWRVHPPLKDVAAQYIRRLL